MNRCVAFACLIGALTGFWALAPVAAARQPDVPSPPSLGAASYVLMAYQSGQTLAAQHADRELPPGSVSKLMVGYIVFGEIRAGRLSPETEVTVSEKAWRMHGPQMFLEVGDEVSIDALLHGLITTSGNDAAVQLAQYIAGTTRTFVTYMNQYAQRLNLTHSHFANVTGQPAKGEYVSAADVARLYAAMLRRFPQLYRRYYSQKSFTYNGIHQYNRNSLLWADPRVGGGIVGADKAAGYHLAASARHDGTRVIAVVLGARSARARKHECDALINYAFRFYRNGVLWPAGQPVKRMRVWKGDADQVAVMAKGPVNVTYPRGQRDALVYRARLPVHLIAPIHKGERLGELRILYNERLLKDVPLYAGATVGPGNVVTRVYDDLRLMLGA
ncbi:D-alanyl-D-alanine carboxypeptidase family protein [Salinisphaera sp.]|uniref:D-alanyl-D-alanine carboxypeptidase family protein n=1 Tax=Salinisphaera sp. TaxID=1914330 RepID=UPI002D7759FA|nr:D-alanyl-D-alanine carboxypeptidase family protein [Salinisphaera sp.]HET7312870.1 D-alanyl-D-alanine carboxypeptidase family protein [Salinisphaera sp.]